MELSILEVAAVLVTVFASGFWLGVRSEKGLWERNCLREVPHYSDGVPYKVIKLGTPYYAPDEHESA